MIPLLASLAYLFIGRVFVFITRDGMAKKRLGQVVVAIGWPFLVLVMFGFIALEMIQTGGKGYPEED